MNEALKVIEAMLQLVHDELFRVSMDNSLPDAAYLNVREAIVDSANLKIKVEAARGWNAKQSVAANTK